MEALVNFPQNTLTRTHIHSQKARLVVGVGVSDMHPADLTSFPPCVFLYLLHRSAVLHTLPLLFPSLKSQSFYSVSIQEKYFSPGIPHGSRPGVREKERERKRERKREGDWRNIGPNDFLCGDGLSLFY